MGVVKKGLFCLVDAYDDQDHIQQNEEEEDDDLEMIMEEEGDGDGDEDYTSSFDGSSRSGSSLDSGDDSSSSTSSLKSNGALYDLSELMSNLPIKRGLSKFYQGKSQSFTSLATVTSLEDLAKKSNNYGGYARRMKPCKTQKSPHTTSPKSTISKRSSSSSSLSCFKGKMTTNRTCFIRTKASLSCVQKANFN
ncbi:hypothetical protein V2J09_004514 [Rumex salicifolius]